MTGQFCTVLAGCAFAMILGTSSARAASGRIAFSGAVVAPTCAVSQARLDALQSHQVSTAAAGLQLACQGATASAAAAPTTYSLTVTSLDTTTTDNNRLLTYFLDYVNAADKTGTQAKLVTQIFS